MWASIILLKKFNLREIPIQGGLLFKDTAETHYDMDQMSQMSEAEDDR